MKQIKSTKMLLASIALGFLMTSNAQIILWQNIPSPNNDVHTTGLGNNDQKSPDVSAIYTNPDTRYGVVWQDKRNAGTNFDIYFQAFDWWGAKQFGTTGTLICNASGIQQNPRMISNNTSYFWMAWEDQRSGNNDIYIQQVSGIAATVNWNGNGVAVSTVCGGQTNVEMAVLNMGNEVVVTWTDDRNGNYDIYAQKFNASGVEQWTNNGILVAGGNGDQVHQKVVSDGSGNCVIVWEDQATNEITAQMLDNSGAAQWTSGGIVPCTTSCVKSNPELVYNGSDYFLSWIDQRNGSTDPYFMMINSSGSPINSTDPGMPASNTTGLAIRSIKMISDRSSGMFITWDQFVSGSNWDIYAQNIASGGSRNTNWPAPGKQISSSSVDEKLPKVASCGSDLIITYEYQNGASDMDIYYQILAASNATLGTGGALANLSTPVAKNQQNHRLTIMQDRAFAAWDDWRFTASSGGIDVYCSPVTMACTTTTTSVIVPNETGIKNMVSGVSQFKVYPNPSARVLTVSHPTIATVSKLTIMSIDGKVVMEIENFKVGSTIDVSNLSVGEYVIKFSGEDSSTFRIIKQ